MTVLVVGSVAYDSIETPFGKQDDVLGGSANGPRLHGGAALTCVRPPSTLQAGGGDRARAALRLRRVPHPPGPS